MTNKERLAALETGQQFLIRKIDKMDEKADTNFKLLLDRSVSNKEINIHRGLFAVIIASFMAFAAKIGLGG